MIDDLDAYRAAAPLIKQHGDDAELRAAERSDKLIEEGDDVDDAAVWRRILAAIEELQRGRQGG